MDFVIKNQRKRRYEVSTLFVCNDTASTEIYTYGHTLSLHDALPISVSVTAIIARSRASRRWPNSCTADWRKAVDSTAPPAPSSSSIQTSAAATRSEEHTSELQSLMRISYAVFCLQKKHNQPNRTM